MDSRQRTLAIYFVNFTSDCTEIGVFHVGLTSGENVCKFLLFNNIKYDQHYTT